METKTYIEINQEQFRAIAQLPADTPVVMLNLLKFKEAVPETGLSGAATYAEYMKASNPFFERAKAEILFLGRPQRTLIGPEEDVSWDKILLIKYPTVADFLGMVKAEGYPVNLRNQALEDSRLIYCK